MKLKAKAERCNAGRISEVEFYYNNHGSTDSLEKAFADLQRWYPAPFKVGRGASHVWLSDYMGNRILIVTES